MSDRTKMGSEPFSGPDPFHMPRHRWWILAFVALYGIVALFVTNSYQQLIMTVVPVWAVMGLSWIVLV